MRGLGFAAAIAASILFGVGGTFAQFLFQHRGVNIDWLVTMRLLFAGSVLLLVCAIRQGWGILAIWRTDAVPRASVAVVSRRRVVSRLAWCSWRSWPAAASCC